MTAPTRTAIALASLLIAAAPLPSLAAQSASGNDPVALQFFDEPQYRVSQYPSALIVYVGDLHVRFVNTTDTAATRVDLTVTRNARREVVVEKGVYAPHQRIERRLNVPPTYLPVDDASVVVSRVDFADGTTWTPLTGRVGER